MDKVKFWRKNAKSGLKTAKYSGEAGGKTSSLSKSYSQLATFGFVPGKNIIDLHEWLVFNSHVKHIPTGNEQCFTIPLTEWVSTI